MFYSRAKREIQDLLEIFDGMSADDIAAYLVEHGYYGISTASSCPIARFIRTHTPYEVIHVTRSRVEVRTKLGPRKVYLPENVFEFIVDFDYGKYPLLIDRSTAQPIDSPIYF